MKDKSVASTQFFPYSEFKLGASAAPQSSTTWTPQHARFQPTSFIPQPEEVSNCRHGHWPPLSRSSEKTNLQGRVQWHTVSSVMCHVTWRVIEMERAIGVLLERRKQFADPEQKSAICVRLLRCREWNCSCSNWVMRTLALRDSLTLKEQT